MRLLRNLKNIWDSWHNQYASINCNNSLINYTQFNSKVLTYKECELLSEDPICNQAINTISKDIVGNKGIFTLLDKTQDPQNIITQLEDRLRELNFWETLKFAIEDTLIYGGSLFFMKTARPQHTNPTPFVYESYAGAGLQIEKFIVLPPSHLRPDGVNFQNPDDEYYMSPEYWVLKNGKIHSSFAIPIIIFHSRMRRRAMYNYFGISLLQFMKDSVRNFESIQATIHDMCLRFRTTVIKSKQPDLSTEDFLEKIKYFISTTNNYSVLLLNEHEDIQQIVTNLAGMDRIISQAQQSIASSARMPAVKLLGLSPQGLNNTGEFDMKNYYDHIESYQKSIFEPIVTKVGQAILWSLGFDFKLKFEFTPIAQESYIEREQRNSVTIGNVNTMLNMGVIDDEGALQYLRAANILDDTYDLPELDEEDEEDLGTQVPTQPTEPTQPDDLSQLNINSTES